MINRLYNGAWNRISLTVFIFLSLTLVACSDDPLSPPGSVPITKETSIIPLALGNKWEFRDTHYDSDGTFLGIDSSSIFVDTMFNADGWTWHHTNPDGLLMSIRSDGVWLRGIYLGSDILWHRYPARSGDTTILGVVYPGNSTRALHVKVVVAVDTMITVPAGTFKCIGYQSRYLDDQGKVIPGYDVLYKYTDYYSLGVGFVLIDQYGPLFRISDTAFLEVRRELIHATIN